MTDKEVRRFSMYMTVDESLLNNVSVTDTNPFFPPLITEFRGCIKQIGIVRETQEVDKTGITARKNELREELIQKVLEILRKIEAYAVISSNVQLKKEVHYNESTMKDTPDSILKDISLVIYNKATENIDALSTYGITKESLGAFLTDVTNFSQIIAKPRSGRVLNKDVTATLKELFVKGDKLLVKMDALVEVLRTSNPEFYKNYKNSRITIEPGRKIAFKGGAFEKITGAPVKGVKFSFENTESTLLATARAIIKKTHIKGRFYIKSIEKGSYKVAISKLGYKDRTVTVNINEGETADLVVEMERA